MKQPQYNTALYMRLSRDDESFGDSVSIETQCTVLTQFVREHPEFHMVSEFVDACIILEPSQEVLVQQGFPVWFYFL